MDPRSGSRMTRTMQNPIGIFDSGIGGLTVLKSLIKFFPNENFVYLGDTARVPYGTKSAETVIRYSKENTDFLISQGVKAIVVACNTASAVALDELKKTYELPILGVVEPSVKEAYKKSKAKKIGIIGTKRTISSRAYENALLTISNNIKTVSTYCPLFVPLVEEGLFTGKIVDEAVRLYLKNIKKSKIDTLILGCTHYPLLKSAISKFVGKKNNSC
jgi:glutamate racemase